MTALHDLRFAFRALRRAPGFTVVAVTTLALGIGASITIFTVFNAALLRPLPYPNPEHVIRLTEKRPAEDTWNLNVAPLDYLDWRERSRGFVDMGAHEEGLADLTGDPEPERVSVARVSVSFFRVLGVTPIEGRTFVDGEDEPGRDRVVLVSHALWKRRFGGDSDLVGRTLVLDGEPHVVAGILPPSFWFLDRDTDLFRPLVLASEDMRTRSWHILTVVARLAPGVTVENAREEMDRVGRALEVEYPETNEGHGAHAVRLEESLSRDVRPALQLLLLGALSLLLIGCANVANLLLARGAARFREIRIRELMGAGRLRLVAQLLTESALLSLVAGALGLLLAAWSLEWLPRLLPAAGPGSWLQELPVEGRVLRFALGASFGTALLFGLLPALQLTRPGRAQDPLREAQRGSTQRSSLRSALVVSETALALVLLVGAALLSRSFVSASSVAPGFQAEGVLKLRLSLPEPRYPESSRIRFFEDLLERTRALPGVASAGAVSFLPLEGDDWRNGIEIEGRPDDLDDRPMRAHVRFATTGYFETMGVPLLDGRLLEPYDSADGLAVVVINETMAERYWPGERALGRRVRLTGEETWREVVGVVRDVKYWGVDRGANPEMFLPHSQYPFRSMAVVLRSRSEPASLVPALRDEVRRLDPDLPLSDVGTMEELLWGSLSSRRFNAVLLGVFAATAVLLATVGVSSVIAYAVSQRMRELGIRVALGAPPRDLLATVLGRGLALTGVGVALGLLLALALSKLLRGLLFDVSPTDPFTLSASAALLLATAVVATYLPARRALRVDPLTALRQE